MHRDAAAPGAPPAAPAHPPSAPVPPPRQPAPPAYRPFDNPPADSFDDMIQIETEPGSTPARSAPAPVGAHAPTEEEIGKTCPYCRFPLKPGEQVMTCPACRLPHHSDCWNENQGCTTYGCRGVAAVPTAPGRPAPMPSYSQTGPRPELGGPDAQQSEILGRANTALTLALISMFVCCFPLGLVGIFMGISILADIKRLNMEPPGARSKTVGAIIVGILSLILTVVVLVTLGGLQGT